VIVGLEADARINVVAALQHEPIAVVPEADGATAGAARRCEKHVRMQFFDTFTDGLYGTCRLVRPSVCG